ncbi:glycosyltransferase [Acidisoma sp. S159]|uniref:glycosyltransferase n=1 Tax=Acidisoma sp. S159 TaxID=1747225 RepID=UPI00131C7787|nr:glycosyltransferase [Acidisoma sp. S159]
MNVVVAGHPFSSSGMGEQVRAGLRALRAVGVPALWYDIFRYAARTDPDMRALLAGTEAQTLTGSDIRVFHINGDEVERVLSHLADKGESFSEGYNIIVPAWELPTYPAVWRDGLAKFDEIWAISSFVQQSLEASGLLAHHVGQSVESDFKTFLPRRFFGIRESSYTVLNLFDMGSYVHRKNPWAVVELFKRLSSLRPLDDIQLIIKARLGDGDANDLAREISDEVPGGTIVLAESLESFAARSLIQSSDCFASLHRSEGFGRGMAEAMMADRLALATGWSGNCDYMSDENSLCVRYSLKEVEEGQYPQWRGQHWAEPDLDHALYLMLRAIDDPIWARQLRRLGRRTVENVANDRPTGLRMLKRLDVIRNTQDF